MSGPDVEQTAEPSVVEERTENYVRMILMGTGALTLDQVNRHAPQLAEGVSAPYLAVIERLRADVAAAEERGARAERERIAAEINRADEVGSLVNRSRTQAYLDGHADGLAIAERIARGTS